MTATTEKPTAADRYAADKYPREHTIEDLDAGPGRVRRRGTARRAEDARPR